MEKAGLHTTPLPDFAAHGAYARSRGLRRRPPVLVPGDDALLQGLFLAIAGQPRAVPITTLAIECGLMTESEAGKLSITRATCALKFPV